MVAVLALLRQPPSPPSPPETLPIGAAALRLEASGVRVLFPDGPEHLRAVPGGWERDATPPDAIYDRYPSWNHPLDHDRALRRYSGLPIGNPPALNALCRDKLATQAHLEAAGLALPEVVEHAQAGVALAEWGAGFAKPRFGGLGRGVRMLVAGEPVPETIQGATNAPEPVILQRAIPAPAGLRALAMRILVQRTPTGWITREPIARTDTQDPVANVARTATVHAARDILPARTIAQAIELALAAVHALADGHTHAVELGVDLVVDPTHQPHLIEVNARPGGRLGSLLARHPERFRGAWEAVIEQPLLTLALTPPL